MSMLAATALAGTLAAAPAAAQRSPYQIDLEYLHDVRDANHDYRRDLRRADSHKDMRKAQRDYRKDMRKAQHERRKDIRKAQRERRKDMRDWRRYRGYDWNRYEPGYSYYYADRYYRDRSEEHTSELQSLMRSSYAASSLK